MRLAFHHLYDLSYDLDAGWWQMLDPELIRTAPLQSIYLMHMQPPLLNMLYAAAVALPGTLGFTLLHLLFAGASLAVVAMLYAFIRRFGASPWTAGAGAALFGVLPQVVLYENLFFYAQLEAVLVLAAAAFAASYFERRRLAPFVGFAACLVVLGMLRSLFHLGWVVTVLIGACVLASRHRDWDRRAIAVAAASIFVVASVYVKNLKEFGIFSASSWDGISLMSMAMPMRGGDEVKFAPALDDIRGRAERGELSPATAEALEHGDVWWGWLGSAKDCNAGRERREVLCAIVDSHGEPNFNHIAIVGYSRDLARDAWRVLRLHPRVYLDHAGSSLLTFLGTPSWDYRHIPFKLAAYTSAWNRLLLYESVHTFRGTGRVATGWWESTMNRLAASSLPLLFLIVAGSAFIVLAGIGDAIGYWRGTRPTADWAFPMLVLALFVSVPNLINGVETQRIRYSIEPLIYLAIFAGVLKWRSR
ncbi:hypothetical protein [Reyranella sp.]|uniref:hypothetical protein n=1 Tax=Reyranella sp. TaxID=1929291 RepID=UPI0025F9EA65|nr:hypothetical protein [Reyranella sp.]